MKLMLAALLLGVVAPTVLFAHNPHPLTTPSRSTYMATASKKTKVTRHPWPFTPLSIGHTISSYQNYSNAPYFHHGIDPRVPAGTAILSSTAGVVVNIENYMNGPGYWEVAVKDDDGFIWQYHHVDRNSIPSAIWSAFRTGRKISAGTKLGEVFYWNWSAFGEKFHHLHLNILGKGGVYLNPFDHLDRLNDDDAPEILEIGLLKNNKPVSGTYVSGNYSIYAKIHDLIKHDKFVVPPHSITFKINNGPETTFWTFDRLPGQSSSTRFISDFYVESKTCGNYRCRELTVNLGFKTSGSYRFPKEKGQHLIEITAKDYAGNKTSQSFSWTVTQ